MNEIDYFVNLIEYVYLHSLIDFAYGGGLPNYYKYKQLLHNL